MNKGKVYAADTWVPVTLPQAVDRFTVNAEDGTPAPAMLAA